MNSRTHEWQADPVLGRLYWGYMLPDILHKLGLDASKEAKERLHEIHKKYLKYPTTAGVSEYVMRQFIFEVCALWACHGLFVRTREDQPIDIEHRELRDVWHLL